MSEHIEVKLSDLSEIKVTTFLHSSGAYETPKYLIIKYVGEYGYGSSGAHDATFMVAQAHAFISAFYATGVILDFTELSYEWGDNMETVFSIGWDRVLKYQTPLAIIVSDKCAPALKMLDIDAYEKHCLNSFEEAKQSIASQDKKYEAFLKEWRMKTD